MLSYYQKYRTVPDVSIITERFKDFVPEPVTGEVAYYMDKLKEDFLSAGLRNMALNIASGLKSDTSPRVMQELQREMTRLNKYTNNVRDLNITDFEDAETHYQAVRERSALMGGSPGIPTGLKAIDVSYPTGFAPGHLIVMIGWPGRGKTFMSSYFACRAWAMGFKPMIVSLEMSPEDMRNRIFALMGSGLFRISDFQRGMVNIDDFHTWGKKTFHDKQDFIIVPNEGMADVSPNTVQAKIDQHRPDLVIVDYHQLFADNNGSRSEVERNKNVSRELKQLAMSNKLPVIDITAATMDDISDQDSPPLLSQVAWSKAIEYDADMAMAVHKDPDSDIIQLISRKNRHGRDFAVYMKADLDKGIIEEHFASNA